MRILVVEDDEGTADFIGAGLVAVAVDPLKPGRALLIW